MKKVVIVGGGITGLSAAFYVRKRAEEKGIPVDITLVEKADRLGGKIQTIRRDGLVIERGPDSFLARKLSALALVRELGMEEELAATNPQAKTNYILRKGKLHPMPLGLVLGIPTKVSPFIRTGLISPLGKLRAAMDLLLPRRKGESDESLGGFIRRRLGREVLDHITEPLLAGIYAGDAQALSLQATFPQFRQLEQRHRSLIRGMLASKKHPVPAVGLPEAARNSMFLSFKGGLASLIERLEQALQPAVRIRSGQAVRQLIRHRDGYTLKLEGEGELQADGLILAVPAFEAAKLMAELPEAGRLERIPYTSVANVALAFRQEDIRHPLTGSGFVVPRSEGRLITACTWTSSKWRHAAPPGRALLRTYVGRPDAQAWMRMSDEQLLRGVRDDLQETMGITAEPVFHTIERCLRSMPQYPVGHGERLQRLEAQLQTEQPGLYLCGSAYRGVGIPDCIQQGKEAAERMLAFID